MPICNCKSARCVCQLDGGLGMDVTGNGNFRNPYVVTDTAITLEGVDSSNLETSVTGTGVTGDPWVVTMTATGSGVQEFVFTSDDTWVKPVSGSIAEVIVIGAGGGGGGGGAGNPAGGGGGAGGAYSTTWIPLSLLPDTVDVTVGQGGGGGLYGSHSAVSGTLSCFGPYLRADGGEHGYTSGGTGTPTGRRSVTTPGGTLPEGGPGGAGGQKTGGLSGQADSHEQSYAPTGGGMGAGVTLARTTGGGLAISTLLSGRGGDGGVTNGVGANGHSYGGGGGGGGATASTGYSGGSGADGIVIVRVW